MMYDNFTIETNEYKKAYWSQAMRGLAVPFDKMDKGSVGGNMYVLPYDSNCRYMDGLAKVSVFRNLATCLSATTTDNDIWVSNGDEPAEWVGYFSGNEIKEVAESFIKKQITSHKLSIITRIDIDFLRDLEFDIEKYLTKDFSKRFGKAENNAFINGTGADMPFGILHYTQGAEVGVTADLNL